MCSRHSGSARIAGAPEVPTFKELGYAALEAPIWFGIVGPGGMAPDVVARLNDTFVQAMRTPALRERMARLDLEIREMSAAAVRRAAEIRLRALGPDREGLRLEAGVARKV